MKVTNFIKERLSLWWLEAVLRLSGWLMTINFVKSVAVITTVCFLLTSVMGHAIASVLENARETKQFNEAIDRNFTLPAAFGRITDGKYFGSEQVVINIQDLHCHAEVQRNITRILSILDEKYKLENVYLEGASGQVDTSWIGSIKDKEIKQKMMESLTDRGRFTGAERYSVISEKPYLIKGIEKEDVYIANFKRLNKIIESHDQVRKILDSINVDIVNLKSTYYNKKQKRMGEIVARYRNGKIDAKKYYRLLGKYSEKLGVDIYGYRNIIAYIDLFEREKKLDYKRVAGELQQFVNILKQKLPYGAYRSLVEKTENFSKLDKVYAYLINLSKEYNINLAHSLPELNDFFNYIEKSQRINPLDLVAEEKKLVGVLEMKFADDQSENEVAFVADFFRYLEDYMQNKISADDYEYFTQNEDKFRLMWIKYIDT
ncbi:MAG: hypothetical protein NT145_06905 [Elusimicrobia bacterium]|nr:hypothetical protein [Elusimicrobiota bacterium]